MPVRPAGPPCRGLRDCAAAACVQELGSPSRCGRLWKGADSRPPLFTSLPAVGTTPCNDRRGGPGPGGPGKGWGLGTCEAQRNSENRSAQRGQARATSCCSARGLALRADTGTRQGDGGSPTGSLQLGTPSATFSAAQPRPHAGRGAQLGRRGCWPPLPASALGPQTRL